MIQNRRTFLTAAGVLSASALLSKTLNKAAAFDTKFSIGCNQYSWHTFYERQGKSWTKDLDASLTDFASSGIKCYEPSVGNKEELQTLLPLVKNHGLEIRSLYINSTLHLPEKAEESIKTTLDIADAASAAGIKIMVTNPSPIKWGSPEDKTDEQIIFQAQALNKLGAELRKRNICLAYHTHDPEMRSSAREFHHMLQATDPQNVFFCLDAHWIYRGSGNSQVALFDIVKMYGKRIKELHIRQSHNGVWDEVLGEGDIDYKRLVSELAGLKLKPHLVLEQCLEKNSPNSVDAVEAHRRDLKFALNIFRPLLS